MHANKQGNQLLELSIIILSYNTAKLTKETVESIYSSTHLSSNKFEIIVLDNASSDTSIEVISQLCNQYTNLRLVQESTNYGFSRGNNRAVEKAKGKYLLFLNSDIVVQENGIDILLDTIKENDSTHFIGGKLLNQDGSPQASCGPFYTLPVVFGALFLRGDYWGLTRYSPQEPKRVDWVSGACIMTTKESFESVGGFDEGIFMYMEEIDLLYRAQKKGMSTYFEPRAQFIHLGSASSKGKTYPILQVYRGFLYFYRKHLTRSHLFALVGMLQLKALIAIAIGKITHNASLVKTYEEAQNITRMA